MSNPTVGRAAREAIGLEEGEEPLFWPGASSMSNPHSLAYCREAQVWLSCQGDAASSIYVLYGPEDEGFEWQNTGRQFADYSCSWSRVMDAYGQ